MTADVTSSSHTKNPISLLLSLPREIRDYICTFLLRAGDLAILRTSKQLSHEGTERLYREGVCRMKIGLPNGGAGDSFFPQDWKHFQNFQFCIFYGPRSTLTSSPVIWKFERFADFNAAGLKRECLIIIEYGPLDPRAPTRRQTFRMKILLAAIASLITFKTVVLVLAPENFEVWRSMAHPIDEKTMVDTWSVLKGRLEPKLGPAKLVGDAGGKDGRLVFHPREFRSSLARRQENSES